MSVAPMNPFNPPPEILLLDDDPMVCAGLGALLRRSGYVVHAFDKGREAKKFIVDHPVALIITDILMPEVDGLEFIQFLRQQPTPPVVFAMSGSETDHGGIYLKMAQLFGVKFTFTKPFDPRLLVDAIVREIGAGVLPVRLEPSEANTPR